MQLSFIVYWYCLLPCFLGCTFLIIWQGIDPGVGQKASHAVGGLRGELCRQVGERKLFT